MTGLVRRVTLLTACGLLSAGAAIASVPSPANSTIPCGISLVGRTGGNADPIGCFTVTVRDFQNTPIANIMVTVNFGACSPSVRTSSAQPGTLAGGCSPGPYDAVSCSKVSRRTDAAGVARFSVVGAGNNTTPTPGDGAPSACAVIDAGGTVLGKAQVSVYDLNGVLVGGNPVNTSDLSLFLIDLFAPAYRDRADYDHNVLCAKTVTTADLSKFLILMFGGNSADTGIAYCP